MLYIIVLLIVIFIFPLFITSYIYVDTKLKKLFFAIYLFGFIKILDGYVTKRELGGFYIHIKNKAIIIDDVFFNRIKGEQSMLKAFHLTNLNSQINLSTNSFYILYFTILLNFIKNIAFKYLNKTYFLQSPKVDVNVTTGNFILQAKIKINILFNLFCITYAFITNYISKEVKNVKTSKQN